MRLILSLLTLAVLGTACNKDDNAASADEARAAAERMSEASAAFSGAYDQTNTSASQQGQLNGFDAGDPVQSRNCGTIQLVADSANFWPVKMYLDYGAGCTMPDQREVSGMIIATFDGMLHAPGTSINLEFDAFNVDGYELSGTYNVLNQGDNNVGQRQHLHTITDADVTYPDGEGFIYNETTTTTMVEGQMTNFFTNGLAGILDDVWTAEKAASLTNSRGMTFNLTTTEAVRRPITCHFGVSGLLEITGSILTGAATLDFGDGTCDDEAVVTYDGVDYTITLRR